MIIDYQAKGERLFTTGCSWTFALIFLAAALTLGPARDENGVPYSDWKERGYIGYAIILLLVIAPTFRRQTRVNFQNGTLVIWDLALFILPIRWKRIAVSEIQSIEYEIRKKNDNRRILFVSVRSKNLARSILQRSDEDGFTHYMRQAEEFASRLGVNLLCIDNQSIS